MKLNDLLWMSYKELAEKKVRSALTIVMVVIGVASIVALISLTEGISASISSELSSLGPTSIIMTSTSPIGFTSSDVATLQTLPYVNVTIPILEGRVNVLANNQNTSATLLGISPQGLQELIGNIKLYQGTSYTDTVAPDSLAGHDVAFPSAAGGKQALLVGQAATLQLQGKTTKDVVVPIVGILQTYGASIISVDGSIIMSLQAAEVILGRSSFNTILVKATNSSTVPQLTTLITDVYGSRANVLNTQQIAQTANQIIGTISTFLVLIAGISLVVAAIGIMNIMLISVFERTHEIGILKAIGFKSRNILMMFLVQALVIGFIGGIFGIIAGVGGSYALTALASGGGPSTTTTSGGGGFGSGGGEGGGAGAGFAASSSSSSFSFQPVLSVSTMVIALVVAMIVSVIAGVYPAWRASKLEPIDALRQL